MQGWASQGYVRFGLEIETMRSLGRIVRQSWPPAAEEIDHGVK